MPACAVKWCVALASGPDGYCPVHHKHPNFKPEDPDPEQEPDEDGLVNCLSCKGTGQCPECDGDGSCVSCGHHCDTCEGEGSCIDCDGLGKVKK